MPYLERALDALAVVGRQPRGCDGVDLGEFGVHCRPAQRSTLCIEARTHCGFGGWHLVDAVDQRLEVKHRAANEQRQPAAPTDFRDQPRGVRDERGGVVAFARVADVDEVVRHGGQFGSAGFRGADVHAAVRPMPNRH
jgi:hypothetical protein